MDYSLQLEKVVAYVKAYFTKHADPNLLYHNYSHTVTVVERVNEIAAQDPLNPKDLFVLTTAAWFHDTGQLVSYGVGHEEMRHCHYGRLFPKD